MNARTLRMRLAAGKPLRGALLRVPGEELVEMAGVAGLDFLVLDCEHGPSDVLEVRRHIVAAHTHAVPVLVRVGEQDGRLIQRVLDHGAAGIVVPHVDSPADAVGAVAATRYPPEGHRGFATYGRAGRYGTVSPADHLAAAADTLLIVMIETQRGVEQAADILTTPGIDGVMAGPADLAITLNAPPGGQEVRTAITQVHEAAATTGRLRMDIVASSDAAENAINDGCMLVVHNLTAHLMGLLHTLAQSAKQA
ncbi:aldolase/citrate lyase family protein [Streptomyces longwoodensis]|uniref:HpcH/HpaI aldolase family protein n=1 Tax=Streptomyces longwoodensis TaxID=68231 RepID=UPI00340E43E2